MLALMRQHYVPWQELSKSKGDPRISNPTNDLSYIRSPLVIGFDHSGSIGFEREYMLTLLRWMSLKIGRLKTFKLEGTHPESKPLKVNVPFINVEETKWPVLQVEINDVPRGFQWAVCDLDGMRLALGSLAISLILEPEFEISLDQLKAVDESFRDIPKEGAAFQEWDRKRGLAFYALMQKDIDAGLDLIRNEIRRLNTAWGNLSPSHALRR